MPLSRLAAAFLVPLALAGCSLFGDEEERLAGERLSVRQALPDPAAGRVVEAGLPPVEARADWTQTGGGPAHAGGHLAFDASPSLAWSADAGTGDSDESAITSAPVVADGRVFTLDAAAQVSAFDAASGAVLWRLELIPDEDADGEEGFGGGLAATAARVVVTTGFGEVVSIDADTGEIAWRRRLPAPFRAGPALASGVVVAVTRSGEAYALDAGDGRVLWRQRGMAGETAWLGGANPLIAGRATVVPYPSGELVAYQLASGQRGWSAVMTGGRRGLARSAITDLTGDPAVVGNRVVVANQSGRIAAFEGETGRRAWTRQLGATRALWAAGTTVYLVSDTNVLTRLEAESGRTLWERELPSWEDPEDREDPILHSGPVLAGGQVWLTDSLGNLRAHDGVTGEGGPVLEMPAGAITGPVVAGGTLYVLTSEGELLAYR